MNPRSGQVKGQQMHDRAEEGTWLGVGGRGYTSDFQSPGACPTLLPYVED